MKQKPLKFILLSMILAWLVGMYQDKLPEPVQDILRGYNAPLEEIEPSSVILTDQRKTHILYGDGRGGGHKYGAGVPCKSEFPKYWDEEMILSTAKKIAANDNLGWEQQNNGYYVAEAKEDGVNVRVVLGPQKRNIITSYPTNMPRNPCPPKRPANDNRP